MRGTKYLMLGILFFMGLGSQTASADPVLDEWQTRCSADSQTKQVICTVAYAMNSEEGLVEIIVAKDTVSAAPNKDIGIIENIEVKVDENAPISSDENSDTYNSIKEKYGPLVKQMKAGKEMEIRFVRFNSASLQTSIPLTGFTKAYQKAGFSGGS